MVIILVYEWYNPLSALVVNIAKCKRLVVRMLKYHGTI